VIERLQASGRRVTVVPASAIAAAVGESRAANTVMLGALSTLLELPDRAWNEALRTVLRPKALEVNLRAFERGRELMAGG
jgi:indolepyruvate ferredoxin oxidoreductase beta subunit